MDAPTAQVKVIFTTNEADLELPESKRQLLVPADIKRYGLSRILNSESMLDTASPIPLDFLANGAFLTTSIEEYLATEGLSSESTLTLQYVRSLLPPSYEASFQHDDWVGAVDCLSATSAAGRRVGDDNNGIVKDRIASASYDGLVRVWNPQGEVVATSTAGSSGGGGHSMRLNAVRWLSTKQIASAGLDRKVVVWDYTDASDNGSSGSLRVNMELWGHEKAVLSLDANLAKRRLLTASADGRVGLWSTSKSTAPQADPESLPSAHTTKKARLAGGSTTAQRGPLAMISAHEAGARVTAALFHPHDATVAPADHQAPAAVRGGDPREAAAATAAMTLRGHVNMVVALAAGPDNDYSLVSGAHDGTCRVWDLRSSARAVDGAEGGVVKPAYTIGREWLKGKKLPPAGDGAKVLTVAWDKTWGIVSAGEDKKVQINRGHGLLAE
ncbi:WD40/YVTN repeat-like-containing domain protein [Cordyceps fumosorosea ARSEF 2679]|uniref:WD40/YVTN repeat-like-containing domain protein n=1 Tax=Cordyceps fumosorosea (strain ARSEF 2679) TaxID=1081104 RepID=A0A167ZKA3_CORFA|nr:WD40/YVTN repeat-like-containing domain protein [Cordyceps fumosorosea ARSEF 2679]OAA67617.1 WD40/YVTN repeat-like-containing domain protein [Cordyceps fumosorosea ARSEF 2679]